jgi:hypothetical protein
MIKIVKTYESREVYVTKTWQCEDVVIAEFSLLNQGQVAHVAQEILELLSALDIACEIVEG